MMLKKFIRNRTYWTVCLFLFPITAAGQENRNSAYLNLGFEQLDKDGTPVGVKWQEDVGKYEVSIDSLDKVEGKYSLKLQSEWVPGGGRMSFVDVLYHLKGDYLAKKEVLVTLRLRVYGTINILGRIIRLNYYFMAAWR